ncbi:hypothetical protein SAMN06298216_4256 [Spirosomataceae bacterium TFI 002]|nr:hypothetical protein SAMN06298216_4256 [Spirosomataceae bacterium TFI 002]
MLKIIFVIVLVIAFVAPVRRFLFWLIVGKQLTKEQKRYNQQTQKSQTKREGEINVDYVPNSNKKDDFKGGQYIDYEEVKD